MVSDNAEHNPCSALVSCNHSQLWHYKLRLLVAPATEHAVAAVCLAVNKRISAFGALTIRAWQLQHSNIGCAYEWTRARQAGSNTISDDSMQGYLPNTFVYCTYAEVPNTKLHMKQRHLGMEHT